MSREHDPWHDLSRACSVLHLAANNGTPTTAQWQRCDDAYAAVECITIEDGMTLALTERYLRETYHMVKVLGLAVPETRNALLAAVRLFARVRSLKAENSSHPARSNPRYYWQDNDV